ncbi:MAG: cytochrome c peroxidase, partial [bacterium]
MSTTKRAFGWAAVAGLILACGDLARSEPQSLVLAENSQALADPNKTVIPRVPDPPLDLANLPGDLRAVAVPAPSNLNDFVKDPVMAVALGKALFWDMQVGSDGVQACASCHFRAGADPRSKNQVSPGLRHAPEADLTYSTGTGPNHQLQASDFPLTRLVDPSVRGALDPVADSNDAVSSQGIDHPRNEEDPQGFFIGSANRGQDRA